MKTNNKKEIQEINTALQSIVTPVGLNFEKNKFALGENYCRIYAIVKYPAEVDYGWYSKITNIPGTIVAINFTPLNKSEFLKAVSNNTRQKRSEQFEAKSVVDQVKSSKIVEDSIQIIKDIEVSDESAGLFSTLIMVMSRDEEDFREKCSRTESIINSLGCVVRILSHLQKEAYQHISPTYKQIKYVSDVANRPFLVSTFTGGFPFANSGFCDNTGFYLGRNADGGIVLFDLWKRDDKRANSSIVIIGKSGMGKSTCIKHIIRSEFARGTKVIIIDPDGEYKEMCLNEQFKGNWIDVSGGRGGIINPFQIRPAPRDENEESESADDKKSIMPDLAVHLKYLQTFFKLYLPDITDKHKSVIDKELVNLYETFGITWTTDIRSFNNEDFPTFSDFHKLLKEKHDTIEEHKEIYSDLILYLESAVSGADQWLWNGHTTIKPDNDFIVLDTQSVSQMSGGVLAAQYYNVLSWCWEQMSKDRTERVLLVADEAWKMVDAKCPESLKFLNNTSRRCRKYESALVIGSQSIVEFLNPEVKTYGQPVLEMPYFKIIFGLADRSLDEAKELFALNEAQYDLVSSQTRRTALFKIGSQSIKIKFELSQKRLQSFGKGGGR